MVAGLAPDLVELAEAGRHFGGRQLHPDLPDLHDEKLLKFLTFFRFLSNGDHCENRSCDSWRYNEQGKFK